MTKEDFALLRESLEQTVAFKQGDKTAARTQALTSTDTERIKAWATMLCKSCGTIFSRYEELNDDTLCRDCKSKHV